MSNPQTVHVISNSAQQAIGLRQLKQQLARQFPYDIESYIKGKNHLVLENRTKSDGMEGFRKPQSN